jgi:hypothetical protein
LSEPGCVGLEDYRINSLKQILSSLNLTQTKPRRYTPRGL